MYDLDIKEALSQLPQQEVDLRNQQLKRAMDYSCIHISKSIAKSIAGVVSLSFNNNYVFCKAM
jgi:hypothetical protein